MAGSIKAQTNKAFHDGKTAVRDITAQHQGSPSPKFGGEFEIFLTRQDGHGIFSPIAYDDAPCGAAGTNAIIKQLIKDHGFSPLKQVEGKPVLLEGLDGSIISFEKYASVIERADKAYKGANGLTEFASSVESFAGYIETLSRTFNMKASPFDYDIFCRKEHFTPDKQAPSERFGDNGMLGHYDNDHPLVDAIDRHTTSGHFSLGYEDRDHLWRMTKALTKLTPSLYAAFAASPPTYLAISGDQKELLTGRELKEKEKEDSFTPDQVRPVLVPRALAWTLADKNRTGLPDDMIALSFEENNDFSHYVAMICNKADIIHTAYDKEQSFLQTLSDRAGSHHEKNLTLNDYITHIGTIWHDFRADTVRLESRMPGNAVWKSKATAALLVGALQNREGLVATEKYLDSLTITPRSLRQARDEVAFDGLQTAVGEGGLTLKDMLLPILDIARAHIPAENAAYLDPLEKVLQSGLSDSDVLKMIDEHIDGDYSAFLDLNLTEIKPFIQMYEEGKLANIAASPLVPQDSNVIVGTAFKKGGIAP